MSGEKTNIVAGNRLPPRLLELPEPPPALHVRGELPRGPMVAIVGTRRPTAEGAAFAHSLARDLSRAGVAVLSGGALGIDTAAHEGSLAADGVTVVVAPAGYDAAFPEENAGLFARVVASGGAYVALVPDWVPAARPAFFQRNRCLVALAQVTVVVQAPVRSGARNAAKHARRLGRPLMVVPASPWTPEGRGCNAELRLGAELCESARDVLARLDALGAVAVPPRVAEPAVSQQCFGFAELDDGDADLPRIAQAAREGVTDPDALCRRLELPAARIQRALLTLQLRGVLVPGPHGGLILCNSP